MSEPDGFGLDRLNAAEVDEARTVLQACCVAAAWVEAMVSGRPYADESAVLAASDRAVAALDDSGLPEAVAGHPRIGERAQHEGAAWSRAEQSGAATGGERTSAELAEGNRRYEERFGHVYLVSAAGRSGQELLEILRGRLGNDPVTELAIVRTELAAINRGRLLRLIRPVEARR
jgi:2-oxo-4-hydroxy-4-carboxy-5-ureidoimidazoline decarboxylase